ncbi:YjfB family protein [Rhodocyclus tenuis]|uniref:Motility protein n=1 Tax=Rhodocyclus tenuis TaxID=1066 RepID=A0A840FVJ8_RHOTE|nr:YjfB family protein [Rhodocyclus tenuis]MBB4246117.1 hypothetical protein [Rhodocyclus tenuis]MBK1680300.1 hypothetical protein [Rhodocyclus tenuis]
MDISSIASVPSSIAQAKTGDAIAVTVLRKSLDLQAQAAMQLIAALPQATTNNPPNLGQGVNTFA